jgi:dolichol-phosphate mannosyltransferase
MNVFLVPAYNEEANVPRLIADLEGRPELWTGGLVVIVDDGSADRTADVAEAYDGPLPVDVLRLGTNQGPGRAFDAGFRRALALDPAPGFIVTLEADTTSDLDALERMLVVADEGADLVLASVHAGGRMTGVGPFRRFMSRSASYAIRRSAGLDTRTVSSFFRVYRTEFLQRGFDHFGDAFIREHGFACKAEILFKLVRLGARVEEVPVTLDASRRLGESKLRVAPTVAGYARLMTRQVVERRSEAG